MSASVEGGSGQDVDLNLAPIIDCFTVLITYLLITASFINLAAMDVGVSATGAAAPLDQPVGPPPMIMTMLMSEGGRATLTVTGGTLRSDMVVAVEAMGNGSWNLNEISGRLRQITTKWPQIKDVSVSAEPTIKYKDIVNVINETQRTLPKVFISGS
jgi:biopolymer transport protein ExbD